MPGLSDVSLTLEPISNSCLIYIALHGPHCLSYDFKWSAKLALENSYSNSGNATMHGYSIIMSGQ